MRKTLRRHRGDPHGARKRWGIENQDHPPSRETITQESGLRENRTSRLSERTEEGRQPDLLRLYTQTPGVMAGTAAEIGGWVPGISGEQSPRTPGHSGEGRQFCVARHVQRRGAADADRDHPETD